MRVSILTVMASTAIFGTVVLLFPDHQVATPAYAVASSHHGHLTLSPVKPDHAIPLPAAIAGYGVSETLGSAVPIGTFRNSHVADLERVSSQVTLPTPTRGINIRADEAIAQFAMLADAQNAGADGKVVERAGYATSLAESPSGVNRAKRVAHRDLDLSLPQDQSSLHARIRSAAKNVCGPRGFSRTEKVDIARCEAEALAIAMPKVERSIMRAQRSLRTDTN